MKYLALLLLVACVPKPQTKNQIHGVVDSDNTDNRYEIIRIGDYECVGMDGYKSGGVWCNRITK